MNRPFGKDVLDSLDKFDMEKDSAILTPRNAPKPIYAPIQELACVGTGQNFDVRPGKPQNYFTLRTMNNSKARKKNARPRKARLR